MLIKFLGTVSVICVVGLIICVLAFLGYNTYIKYQDRHKKIEVRAENSNFKKKIR